MIQLNGVPAPPLIGIEAGRGQPAIVAARGASETEAFTMTAASGKAEHGTGAEMPVAGEEISGR